MNDLVRAAPPASVEYSINFRYWINKSDAARAATIQAEVTAAVSQYIKWQRKIGRDINPDELNRLVKNAGAKRLVIEAPIYTVVPEASVATLEGEAVINYGGLEND